MKQYEEQVQILRGRSLLVEEIPFRENLQIYLDEKLILKQHAMTKNKTHYTCNRCLEQSTRMIIPYPCSRCNKICYYCRKCLQLGRVTSCSYLYTAVDAEDTINEPVDRQFLQWKGQLSPGQQTASEKVIETIENRGSLLVWAVCGSGKTEVIFAGINRALQLGQRVAIATPRTDVVHELTPRLKAAFPEVSVISLFGGSKERFDSGQLTISTTHQLLRFKSAFDVIIVDEVDAFPYTADEMLQRAVKNSAKQNATHIYLTATPTKSLQLECKYNKSHYVKIPLRYHGHLLPIPTFAWCGNWRKMMQKNKLPKRILQWIEKCLQSKHPILLFFPHIKLMEQILPILQTNFPVPIESVHSQDENRREKVQAMRDGKITILLTTMILERGVTFSNIAVAVIGAEDATFTESALVQISGRVGRNKEYPTGPLIFFHYGRTKAMIDALNHIDGMNQEAKGGKK